MISSHQEEFLVKKFECRDVFLKSNSQIIRYTCLSCVLFVIAYSVTANVGAINLKSIGGLMSSPGILGLCLLVISATLLLNALRWLLILNSLGHTSSFYQVLGILSLSGLIGSIMPGLAAGEAIRVALTRVLGVDWTSSIISSALDRLIGFFITIKLLVFLILVKISQNSTNELFSVYLIASISLALLMIGFCFSIQYLSTKPIRLLGTKLADFCLNLAKSAKSVLLNRQIIIKVLTLSYIIWFLNILSALCLCQILFPKLNSLVDVGIAFNASMIANLVPITPGGFGFGETAFSTVIQNLGYNIVGVGTVLLAWRIIRLLVLCIGSMLLLSNSKTARKNS